MKRSVDRRNECYSDHHWDSKLHLWVVKLTNVKLHFDWVYCENRRFQQTVLYYRLFRLRKVKNLRRKKKLINQTEIVLLCCPAAINRLSAELSASTDAPPRIG